MISYELNIITICDKSMDISLYGERNFNIQATVTNDEYRQNK